MAWTDAARQAAAAARREHVNAKKTTKHPLTSFAGAAIRKDLAAQVRVIRAGRKALHPGIRTSELMSSVRASTLGRNDLRKTIGQVVSKKTAAPAALTTQSPRDRFMSTPGEQAKQRRVSTSRYSSSFGGDASNYRR